METPSTIDSEKPHAADAPDPDAPGPDATGGGTPAFSLFDAVIAATKSTFQIEQTPQDVVSADTVAAFLAERSSAKAIVRWVGIETFRNPKTTVDRIIRLMQRDVARIDALLNRQVNAILHHPTFQKLDASYRGLYYLTEQSAGHYDVKIRVLNCSWRDLNKDFARAIEFDQSSLFRKVYTDEFGTPGGEPYGLLIGDYEICHRVSANHPTDDLSALQAITQVAAAAFAPFIASVSPTFFGVDYFSELERPINLSRSFEQTEYLKWRALREMEDARFIGLVLPRVLMRLPHDDTGDRVDGFRFKEDVESADREEWLWGNAAYAFASTIIRAYINHAWFADIRGVERGGDSGGVVFGLPVPSFDTDKTGVALRGSTDLLVTDEREKDFAELGFIPLCTCRNTTFSAFYSNQSIQKPKRYDDPSATINARISAMLQYMLCVSRFAHYMKVICRDKIGSFMEASECEEYLHRWLNSYVVSDDNAAAELKSRYPLREARVEVSEIPGKPGTYRMSTHLRPHFQLDDLVASVQLKTELAAARP